MEATHQEIKKMLKENKSLVFYFKKKDGTIRKAIGTLNPEIIEKMTTNFTKNGYVPREIPNVQRYFDLEKNAWRSFNVDNFINVER